MRAGNVVQAKFVHLATCSTLLHWVVRRTWQYARGEYSTPSDRIRLTQLIDTIENNCMEDAVGELKTDFPMTEN